MTRRTVLSRLTGALATLPVIGRLFGSVRTLRRAHTQFDSGGTFVVANWDVALTDVEIYALNMGVSPMHIRPEHLKEWYPTIGQ